MCNASCRGALPSTTPGDPELLDVAPRARGRSQLCTAWTQTLSRAWRTASHGRGTLSLQSRVTVPRDTVSESNLVCVCSSTSKRTPYRRTYKGLQCRGRQAPVPGMGTVHTCCEQSAQYPVCPTQGARHARPQTRPAEASTQSSGIWDMASSSSMFLALAGDRVQVGRVEVAFFY